jgi:hypothetical protein
MSEISETCGAEVEQRYECCQCPGTIVFVNFYILLYTSQMCIIWKIEFTTRSNRPNKDDRKIRPRLTVVVKMAPSPPPLVDYKGHDSTCDKEKRKTIQERRKKSGLSLSFKGRGHQIDFRPRYVHTCQQ